MKWGWSILLLAASLVSCGSKEKEEMDEEIDQMVLQEKKEHPMIAEEKAQPPK